MANIERIDSLYDVGKISKENEALVKQLRTIMSLMEQIQQGIGKVTGSNSGSGLAKETEKLTAAQKELIKVAELGAEAYRKQAKAKEEARLQVSKMNREVKSTVEIEKAEVNSINAARAALKGLHLIRNSVNVSTKEGAAQLKILNAEIDKHNRFITAHGDAALKQRANIGNYQSALTGVTGAFTRLAAFTGITLGASTVFNFLGGSIEEANQAEQSISRLNNVLTNLGRGDAFDRITDKANELAREFRHLDNDDITEGFQQLVTYGKLTQKQMEDLLPVIIDFSAKSRIGLNEGTALFIKALEGSAKPLKEYGINIKDGANETERLGIIMTQLKPKVDGAAAAFSETFAGATATAKQRIADLKEEIGNNLQPVVLGFYSIVNQVMDGMANAFGRAATFIRSLSEVGRAENERIRKQAMVDAAKTVVGLNAKDMTTDEMINEQNKLIAKVNQYARAINLAKMEGKEFAKIQDLMYSAQAKVTALNSAINASKDTRTFGGGGITPIKLKPTTDKKVKDTLEKDLKAIIAELNRLAEEDPVIVPYEIQPYKGMDTTAAYEAETKRRLVQLDTQFAQEQLYFAKLYSQNLINKTAYEEEILKLTEKYSVEGLEIQIGVLERQKEFATSDIEQTQEVIDRKAELEKQIAELKLALEKKKQDAIDKTTGKEKESIEVQKATLQEFLQFADQALGNAFAAIGEIAAIGLDTQKIKLDELESKQQEAYEREINRINNLNISDSQRADMLSALEAKRTAERLNTERKLRKIEVERARFEKAANIANIITSTALAVVNALKTGGPLAIPLAVSIGALGAAQLARAIATPLPKYFVGTDNAKRGWAWIGEKGTEKVETKQGEVYYTPNKPTLAWLEGGEKITPNHKLSETLPAAAMRKPVYYHNNSTDNVSYFASSVSGAISNQTYRLEKALKRRPKTVINNSISLDRVNYLNRKVYNK